ncbi:uncharacterized protein LOC6645415 [Drosophila willistoni]|nr:uncharacterized protein LOC6645415 [Drosophila willistoni]
MSATKKAKKAVKRKATKEEIPTQEPPAPTKMRIVVTPWRDTSEFTKVYNWLFDKTTSNEESHSLALRQIRIWQYRRASLCPAAVLATSVLIEAQMEDKKGNSQIQNVYASAFTRFYNFMSSIIKGHSAASMYETAEELGLDSFIVDLRHLCAHGQILPPVDVLRKATVFCIEWLRGYYWLPHKESMTNLIAEKLPSKDLQKFTQTIENLLELYDLALECYILKAHKLKAISKLKTSVEFNKLRVYSSKKKAKSTMEMITALVNDMGIMLKKESTSKTNFFQIYLLKLLDRKVFLTAGVTFKENEELVIEATQSIFKMLAIQGHIDDLLVALITLAENKDQPEEKRTGASYWAIKLIDTLRMLNGMKKMYQEELNLNDKFKDTGFSSLNNTIVTKTMKTLLIHSGRDLSVTLIFGDSAKKPRTWSFEREFVLQRVGLVSDYSVEILKGLLHIVEPPFSAEQLRDLTSLCNIRFRLLSEKETKQMKEAETQSNYSLEDLENLVSDYEGNVPPSTGKTYGLFTLDTNPNWSKCALGVLPY